MTQVKFEINLEIQDNHSFHQPDFFNSTDLDRLLGLLNRTLWPTDLDLDTQTTYLINLVFCSESYIRELNKSYRQIDEPTDVLSFMLRESVDDYSMIAQEDGKVLFGEVYISLNYVRKAIKQNQKSSSMSEQAKLFREEIIRDIVHGILHLLGFDHIEKLHWESSQNSIDSDKLEEIYKNQEALVAGFLQEIT